MTLKEGVAAASEVALAVAMLSGALNTMGRCKREQ